MALIETQQLTKRYGETVLALNGLDLVVEPGITGLVGANGAGKSTLIKILLGLARTDERRARGAGLRRARARGPCCGSSWGTCRNTTACLAT